MPSNFWPSPPRSVRAVVGVISSMEDPGRPRLLRAIAVYAEPDLGQRILTLLGASRHAETLTTFAVLKHLIPPALQPLAERQERKLRLAGVTDEAWAGLAQRALWSPINAQGNSILWWIVHQGEQVNLMMMALNDELGVRQTGALPDIDASGLPMPAPLGHVHRLRLPDSHQFIRLVELDPELALRVVEEALDASRAHDQAWPAELVVFGDWLWARSAATAAWPALPEPAQGKAAAMFSTLLNHIAFSAWAWDVDDLASYLQQAEGGTLREGGPGHVAFARRLVAPDIAPILAARLTLQARWIVATGEPSIAAIVMAARQAVLDGQAEHPFVRSLAWRSLLVAAAQSGQQSLRLIQPPPAPP